MIQGLKTFNCAQVPEDRPGDASYTTSATGGKVISTTFELTKNFATPHIKNIESDPLPTKTKPSSEPLC
jgi:hypothetical protein